MVDTLSWILFGVMLYWVSLIWLSRAGLLPSFIGTQGPIITVHTKRFRVLMDWLATPKRVWRAWGNLGLGVAYMVMVGAFLFLVVGVTLMIQRPPPETAVTRPQNVLVIPGVNEFLPLEVAAEIVLGLVIGLVVHEGGHAILCRVSNIEIKSMGLALFAIIPIGAFVEPDDESRRAADRGAQSRMFAAGVMNNFAVAIVVFALLFGPVMGMIGVASGAAIGGVLPGSAAAESGISQGDRIVMVGDESVETNEDFERAVAGAAEREVSVTVADGDGETWTTTVTRSLLVAATTVNTPFGGQIGVGETIVRVDGAEVYTESAFREALENRRVVTLETRDGKTVTGPAGAAVVVREDAPLERAGVAAGTEAVVTAIGGERVVGSDDLTRILQATAPGQEVDIELYVDGDPETVRVTLDPHPVRDHGFLGVDVAPGVSGLQVSDFGAQLYPASTYLGLLGGDGSGGDTSFWGRVIIALQLPLASIATDLPFNFAGFAGGVENFYEPVGMAAWFGGLVFVVANLLFWTAWINLNLGVFNCIPAFPLDGGHLLRSGAEAVVSRLPVQRRRVVIRMITTSTGLIMLMALILLIFGPRLLN